MKVSGQGKLIDQIMSCICHTPSSTRLIRCLVFWGWGDLVYTRIDKGSKILANSMKSSYLINACIVCGL